LSEAPGRQDVSEESRSTHPLQERKAVKETSAGQREADRDVPRRTLRPVKTGSGASTRRKINKNGEEISLGPGNGATWSYRVIVGPKQQGGADWYVIEELETAFPEFRLTYAGPDRDLDIRIDAGGDFETMEPPHIYADLGGFPTRLHDPDNPSPPVSDHYVPVGPTRGVSDGSTRGGSDALAEDVGDKGTGTRFALGTT
jgi:hypothetical protein